MLLPYQPHSSSRYFCRTLYTRAGEQNQVFDTWNLRGAYSAVRYVFNNQLSKGRERGDLEPKAAPP